MTYTELKENHGEAIGVSIAFGLAVFIAYLTFPSFISMIAPEVQFWESPLTLRQGLSVLATITIIGFLFAIAGRLRQNKVTGDSFIPLWLVVTMLAIVSTAITVWFAIFGFGITVSVLLSLGVESSIAIAFGFIMALLAIWVLR